MALEEARSRREGEDLEDDAMGMVMVEDMVGGGEGRWPKCCCTIEGKLDDEWWTGQRVTRLQDMPLLSENGGRGLRGVRRLGEFGRRRQGKVEGRWKVKCGVVHRGGIQCSVPCSGQVRFQATKNPTSIQDWRWAGTAAANSGDVVQAEV